MRDAWIGLAVALVACAVACGSSGGGGSGGGDAGDDGGGSSGAGSSGGGSSGGGSSGSSSGASSSSGSSSGSASSSGGTGGLAFTSAVQIIVEPSDDASALIAAVQGAQTSIHMTMYLLSNTKIIDALIAASSAKKDVKVLLNQVFPSTGANSGSNNQAYSQLQGAGVNVQWAPGAGNFYTHEKGILIDGKVAWIMTMNATQSSPTQNREYLAVDTDASDVAEAEAIFEADWANQASHPKGNLVVSPTNSTQELTTLIGIAQSTVDMEAEELSSTDILGALYAAGDRGVKVHIVLADASSTTATATLKQHGVSLVTFSQYYVHAKSIVVDGKYAYVGSENFSTESLKYNRELGILTGTASEVQKVESTTSSDFAAGSPL